MDERQRKGIAEVFEAYNRRTFCDWVEECVGAAFADLQPSEQVPTLDEAVVECEVEQIFCEVMIRKLQQHLQGVLKEKRYTEAEPGALKALGNYISHQIEGLCEAVGAELDSMDGRQVEARYLSAIAEIYRDATRSW